MGTKITISLLFAFFSSSVVAQTRRNIQGKIVVADAKPSDVLVLNLNTQEESKSNREGFFAILAKPDDVLIFSSQDLAYMRKIIEESEFQKGKAEITMTSKQIVLDEVEIKTYNAVSLGILQKPAKSYTPAERRLQTAGDFKPIHLLAILGGGMPLDPVFNAINGRTKRLKKEVQLERSQLRLQEFQQFFPKEALIDQVKVDPDDVMEFTYFVLNQEELISLLESRDKNKLLFYLIQQHSLYKNPKPTDEK